MSVTSHLTIHPGLFEASRATEHDLAAATGGTLFMQPHATFADLTARLHRRLRLEGRVASRVALRLALVEALDAQPPAPVDDLQRRHLPDSLLELFHILDGLPLQWRKANKLESLLPATPKGRFLVSVHRTWRARLRERGLLTAGDVLSAFLAATPGAYPRLFENLQTLCFEGFVDPNPLEAAAMRHLQGWVSVTLRLHADPDRPDLYTPLEPLLKSIEGAIDAADLDIEFVAPRLSGDSIRSALAARLFREDAPDDTPLEDERLSLWAFENRRDELHAVLNAVRRLLDDGVSPGDIALVAPELEAVRPYLRTAIRESGLPIAYQRSLPVFDTPPFRWLLRLIETLSGEASISVLSDLARAAEPFGVGPGGAECLADLEARLRAEGLDSLGGTAWKAVLPLLVKRDSDFASTEAEACVDGWQAWLAAWRDPRSPAEWMAYLGDRLAAMVIPPFASAHDQRHFALSWHAWQTVSGIVAEWREQEEATEKDHPVRAIDGLTFLKQVIRAADTSIGLRSSPEPETVAVLTPAEAAALSVEHLFVLDLVEDVLPPKRRQTPLLRDSETHLIHTRIGHLLFRSGAATFRLARMQFVRLLMQSRHVRLATVIEDDDGQAQNSSPFFEECRRVLGVDDERKPALCGDVPDCASPAAAARWRQRAALALHHRALDVTSLPASERSTIERAVDKMAAESERRAFMKEVRAIRRAALSGAYTGMLPDGPRGSAGYSAGRFESYATCPFQYWAQNVLDAAPWDRVGPELPPLMAGNAIHDLLKTWGREGFVVVLDDERGLQRVRAELQEAFARETRWLPVLTRRLSALAAEGWAIKLMAFMRVQRERFLLDAKPCLFEADFGIGEDDPLPAPSIERKTGLPIRLRGRIDRVDAAPGVVRLVDYKTSSDPTGYGRLRNVSAFGVSSFQLPIYLLSLKLAVERGDFGDDVALLEGGYLFVGKPDTWQMIKDGARAKPLGKGPSLDDPLFTHYLSLDPKIRRSMNEARMPNLANQLSALVNRMETGDFQITPRDCTHCPFGDACRVQPISIRFDEENQSP